MASQDSGVKGRVLVVEDDEATLKCLETILKHKGYDVTCVRDGPTAICRVAENQYDIILMDYSMPGMDGVECSRLIKFRFPDVPICMLTGWTVSEKLQQFKDAGIDDFIQKPMMLDALLRRIETVMSKS